MSFSFPFPLGHPSHPVMFYILYDLRESKSLAGIHLPRPDEDGPVLLRVEVDDYEKISRDLREMCVNEGDDWMTTLLIAPPYAKQPSITTLSTSGHNTDLVAMCPYIMIAHMEFTMKDPENFMQAISRMQKWRPN